MNYEENLKELEALLNKMESSGISLDEMMENYKKAIKLYNELEKYLNNYKQEIKVITDEGMKDLDTEEINID